MIPVIKVGTGEDQVLYDDQGKKAEFHYNHLDLEALGEYFTELEVNICHYESVGRMRCII